jgi:hypothetical protein
VGIGPKAGIQRKKHPDNLEGTGGAEHHLLCSDLVFLNIIQTNIQLRMTVVASIRASAFRIP